MHIKISMNDPIVKKIEKFVNFTEKNKSSQQKYYLNSETGFCTYNASLGFGSFVRNYDGNIKHCLIDYNNKY